MAFEVVSLPGTGLGKQESTGEYGLRTGARSLARAGERIVGLPGDVSSALLNLGNLGIGAATGYQPLPSQILPTSETVRNYITKPLTGEYLEPQSKGEEFWDEIIGDAATLLIPAKGKVPFGKAALKALGTSAVGNVSKWAAEELTGSPLVGATAKIGSMALAGTAGGRKKLEAIKNESYKDALARLPQKMKFDFNPEKSKLDQLYKTIFKGDRPDKKFLLDRLRSINTISDRAGNVNIQNAITLKQDWNKYLSDPSLDKSSRNILKNAVGIVNKGIERYGSKNPGFYEPYKAAEELTGALQSTNYIQKLLDKHPVLEDKIKNPIIKSIFYIGAPFAAKGAYKIGIPKLAAVGVGALGAREAAKAYQLLSRSPLARKFYKNAIEAGLKNNISVLGKNLSDLNKVADHFEKNESKGKYEVIYL